MRSRRSNGVWTRLLNPHFAFDIPQSRRATPLGFEPRQREPKSLVLPLHYGVVVAGRCATPGTGRDTLRQGDRCVNGVPPFAATRRFPRPESIQPRFDPFVYPAGDGRPSRRRPIVGEVRAAYPKAGGGGCQGAQFGTRCRDVAVLTLAGWRVDSPPLSPILASACSQTIDALPDVLSISFPRPGVAMKIEPN